MNETTLNALLEQIGSQEWNGPGTNKRVERFILERKLSMSKKQRFTIAGIVLGSSLVCAGLAAAVTNQIVSQRYQFVTADGQVFEGEALEPMGPDGTGGTFITSDGSVYSFEADSDASSADGTSAD